MKPWNYARITKVCIQCGNAFLASRNDLSVHCGDVCARKTQVAKMHKPLPHRMCGMCGREFTHRHKGKVVQLFCSPSCLALSRRGRIPSNKQPRIVLTCTHCSKQIVLPKGTAAKRSYCSRKCQALAKRGTVAWNRQERVNVQCHGCGKSVGVTHARAQTFMFCSRACVAAQKRTVIGNAHPLWKPKAQRVCEWCSTAFEAKPAKVLYGEARFCSRQCVGAWVTHTQGGRTSSLEISVAAILDALEEPYTRQTQVGFWSVDFYIPRLRLVIECDGTYWHGSPKAIKGDRRKDGWLFRHGYRVLRLPEPLIRDGRAVASLRVVLAT